MASTINLQDVSVSRDGVNILKNIDWQVEDNQRWVIVGPNGAGKTTLLKVAAAQIQPTSGVATILGERLGSVNIFDLRTRVGFASSALVSHIPNSETVLNAVMTASYAITGRWTEKYEDIDERRARRVLGEWHLSEHADRAFGTLSDGERKRVQLARAVMTDPELLLLDEPVASLDLGAREQTVQLLGAYASSPAAPSMVMVTHHLEEIPTGFTHALLINDGSIVAQGEITNIITSDLLSETFGFGLNVSTELGRFQVRAR
jgi:iron complex transport system ATP-binding protein